MHLLLLRTLATLGVSIGISSALCGISFSFPTKLLILKSYHMSITYHYLSASHETWLSCLLISRIKWFEYMQSYPFTNVDVCCHVILDWKYIDYLSPHNKQEVKNQFNELLIEIFIIQRWKIANSGLLGKKHHRRESKTQIHRSKWVSIPKPIGNRRSNPLGLYTRVIDLNFQTWDN